MQKSYADIILTEGISPEVFQPQAEDYTEDGLLHCGKCQTRKQYKVDLGNGLQAVPISCKCRKEFLAREEERIKAMEREIRAERLREMGLPFAGYRERTFAADDKRNPEITKTCLEYVKHWPEMREKGHGVIFFGDVGTGKSFFACAIANALIDQGIFAYVTSFPQILRTLELGFGEKREHMYKMLDEAELLVIDDLGTERTTEYALQQVYVVVENRSLQKKPLIVTTNLSISEMRNEPDQAKQRIYDRVLEMCQIPIRMTGESRRVTNAKERLKDAVQIVKGGKHEKNQTSS